MLRKDHISEKYCKGVELLLYDQPGLNLTTSLSQEEQDIIWKEISIGIDINDVWNEISSELDHLMPVNFDVNPVVKSLATILIISIGLIPVNKDTENSFRRNPESMLHTFQIDNSTEGAIKETSANIENEAQIYGVPSSLRTSESYRRVKNPYATKAIANNTGFLLNTPADTRIMAISQAFETAGVDDVNLFSGLYEIPLDNIVIPAKVCIEGLNLDRQNSISEPFKSYGSKGKISIGLAAVFKNTWLLNHITFDGFRSESLYTNVAVLSPDVGLSVTYKLKNNWSLQGDGFLYSNNGQEYMQFIDGQHVRNKITLRYSTIVLSAKYSFTGRKGFRDPFAINAMAGGYFSVLNVASQNSDSDIENTRAHYGKIDYGFRVVGEIELDLSDRISVAPGIFLSYGIPDIYKGDGIHPGYFKSTHTGSIGFQFTCYYTF